jgi:hypothetical protein
MYKTIVILITAVLLAASTPAEAKTRVAEFKGTGDSTTAIFRVDSPWLLDWRLDGDYDQLVGLEPSQKGCVHDVYDMVDHCLDHTAIDWDEVDILHATFRFRFDPRRGRRAGSLEFHVTYPDHFSVRSSLPERVALVRKYLKRWRIARA